MTGALILLCALGSYTSTPEEFVQDLVDNRHGIEGARFWQQSAWEGTGGEHSDPDSLRVILEGMRDLRVELGSRTLSEIDESTGHYTVVYPRSNWTWQGSDGRDFMLVGTTVIRWSNGRFWWEELPVLQGEGTSMGITERLLTGLLFTVIILLFGVLALVWAKRKYAR